MDQLQPIISAVKKHYFWVVVGLVVVLGSAVAVHATSKLGSEARSRSSAIDNTFKSVEAISSQQGLPNQQVVELIRKKTALLKENVLAAWQRLYEDQKRNCKLPDEFGEQFVKEFMEAYPDARKEISLALRESYGNFIQKRVEQLEAIVDVLREKEKPAESGSQPKAVPGLGIPSPGGERDDFGGAQGRLAEKKPSREIKQDMIGVVEWNPAERQRIKERFIWKGGAPTTREVLLAQEDLWVYQALLTVIKNTNEGAQRHDKAYVKRIEALDIGRDATQRFTRDTRGSYGTSGLGIPSNVPGALPSGEVDQFSQPTAPVPSPGFPSATASPAASPTAKLTGRELQLLTNRYVDNNGEPLAADAAHPYAEFKMMPIYMRLRIDQRRIPRLLAECANSNMPIEIKAIEFQPGRGLRFDLGALERKSSEDSQGGVGGGGFVGFGSPVGSAKTPSSYDIQEDSDTTYDVTLELNGIIYIFNPPDERVFGTGTASQTQPGTEAQPPQVQPETPATPAQPEAPAQPGSPAQPGAPAQPGVAPVSVSPAQPSVPVQPTAPAEPTAPSQPTVPAAQPTVPAQPEAGAQTAAPVSQP